jgi:hypothetical protein
MIARHDEIPPEMGCLVVIRRMGIASAQAAMGEPALDSISVPRVQGKETQCGAEKLLCGA